MIIANPIYDVVFKYLLEDVDIARGLLATILGEEILSLEVKPQETSTETAGGIHILRFDFKAVLQKKNGTQQKVLIELQKAKQAFDVMRFRRYLGDNYRKEDVIRNLQGASEKRPLPIYCGLLISKILLSYQQALPLLDGIGLYPLYYQLDAMAAKNKFESNADSCQYHAHSHCRENRKRKQPYGKGNKIHCKRYCKYFDKR